MLKLTRWTIAHRLVVILSWFVFTIGLFGLSQAVARERPRTSRSPARTRSMRSTCCRAGSRPARVMPIRSFSERTAARSRMPPREP